MCSSKYKNLIFYFQKSSQPQQCTLNTYQHTQFFIMETFRQIVESTAQTDENAEKLNFFNSMLKVWDFAKISSSEFQSLSFDNKSSLLKKYYVEMLAKYTKCKEKPFFCCHLVIFLFCFYQILTVWVKFEG